MNFEPMASGGTKGRDERDDAFMEIGDPIGREMKALVELDQPQLDEIARAVPGGLQNVQDFYPLAPLQEGILFHHLLNRSVDSYFLSILFELRSRDLVRTLIRAIESVIRRHDVLRTSVVWENLVNPVQVVWKEVVLPVEEIVLDPLQDAMEQVRMLMHPVEVKRDLRKAPLVWLQVVTDGNSGPCYAVLKVHHLICDHQTLRILVTEVFAFLEGREEGLPHPVSFRKYVAKSLMARNSADVQAYFRSVLADIDEPTAPFGILDVHGDGSQLEEAQSALDAHLAEQIRSTASRYGVSAARVFHAAWALVVAKVSARDDVVFGTVLLASNQRRSTAERIFGPSVTTLPLRLSLNGINAAELISKTQYELRRLLDHDTASLTMAQSCSGVAPQVPLFTSILNFRHGSANPVGEDRCQLGIRVLARAEALTNYPVTMTVDDYKDGFSLMAKVDKRIGARRMIQFLVTALKSLVCALETTPDYPARLLAVLPEIEWEQVTQVFNETQASHSGSELIHRKFEEQVEQWPDRIAVSSEDKSITYTELNSCANQLARHLLSRGVRADELVALFLDRSVEMLIGLLGVLKAGGAYVPLDPTNPVDRVRHVLLDAQPRAVLTREKLRKVLGATSAEVIALDKDWEEISRQDSWNLNPQLVPVREQNLAYVIYTSGTTGKPKGVMVEHRNIVNYAVHAATTFDVASGDGSLICTSLSFDLMLTGLYPTLICGRTVRLCPDGLGLPPLAEQVVKCERLAPLKLTPSHLALLDEPLRRGVLAGRIHALVLGGESLTSDAIKEWRAHAPSTRIFNHYGPTEATVGCAIQEVGADLSDSIPLGRPISNARIYVLDHGGLPVPIGGIGEIYIGGRGIARGYLNRPALTAERFIPDPFCPSAGARMYRTGDLGRWRPDGTVEYLGRNDHQVKIRGFRIELGEIEAQLNRHPEVKKSVVVARKSALGDQRLIAYVVPGKRMFQHGESNLGLRAHLRASLPEYMVPSAVMMLESLPLTPNGKVDRRALPEPPPLVDAVREYVAPEGVIEQCVAEIWRELLHVERVSRQDNFFELGGHSLLVVQMLERLRRKGLSTEVRQVFERSTLAELARALTQVTSEQFTVPPNLIPAGCKSISPQMLPLVELDLEQLARVVDAVPGGAANIQDIYPLAPLQEGILFHHLLMSERGCDAYVRPMVLWLSSAARLEELISALQAAIDRHDTLRTAVVWEQLPQPVQVVYRRATLSVTRSSLAGDQASLINDWLSPGRQRLDLRKAPLLRLEVAADSGGGALYVLLQLHHIISDYSSLALIVTEVVQRLQGHTQAAIETIPYRWHVAQTLAYARAHDARAFFRSKLGDVEEPTVPFGLMDVHGDGGDIRTSMEEIEPALALRLRTQAQRIAVTPATLFHAAWGLVVGGTSGREDVVFGTVLSGRMHGNIGPQQIVGLVINTLPLRLRLTVSTARELVEQTKNEMLDLLRHEQASLVVAQRSSGIAGTAPLFTSLFNYRRSAVDLEGQWSGVDGLRVLATGQRTNYPITLSVDDSGVRFTLHAQTNAHLNADRVTSYMHAAVRALVDALDGDGQRSPSQLSILSDDERQAVIRLFNATQANYPHDKSIDQLFEEQVRLASRAVAVVDGERTYTYVALNERANRLARYLLGRGVQIGDFIPVSMSRSIEMLVAQLAILKCGGAYLPLDPELPPDRRSFMIRDCGARWILSDMEPSSSLVADGAQWINCKRISEIIERLSGENLHLPANAERPAYVMYTSGSTGVPKGVVVPHRAVNRLVINNGYLNINSDDCLAHYSNTAFDASTFEVWGALLNGARLVIVPQGIVFDSVRFGQLLQAQRVTILWMSVGLFNQYTEALARVLAELRCLIVGGDTLEVASIARVMRSGAPRRFLNGYGPTECTTFSTTYSMESLPEGTTSIPIGRPISNAQVYILNDRLKPVPIGVAGEIYIGGAGVALGYLKRAELTSERFLPDPFSESLQSRMYRTGDLGRWTEDGLVEFVGRNDHQIKIRGFRIELGEIEARLTSHPDVSEAVVALKDKRLVAYVVPVQRPYAGAAASAEGLRRHLKSCLPEYMVPSAIVLLNRMPLTQNGKLDRRALPHPESDAYAGNAYEPPIGDVEVALASIWRELLNVPQIGRRDNLFDLGAHSLMVLQSLLRIQKELERSVSVRDVYQNPTLFELALRISGGGAEAEALDLAREAELDDAIVTHGGRLRVPAQTVLLTGATGFVGRFLLVKLLTDTRATIYCLVRALSQQEASLRLRDALKNWGLWRDEFEHRIISIAGDLRLRCLGLDDSTYHALSQSVDSIYHCATSMNHLETYAMAKAANVDSARELLRLATNYRPKLVNYISTLSVFRGGESRIVDEATPIEFESHSKLRGYAASKWVGEKLFMIASERGIACNIFRLGLVWADSEQGRYSELQRECMVLKSSLISGYGIKDYRYDMMPTPVDYVARSVVALGNAHANGGGVFHIAQSRGMDKGIFEMCNESAHVSLRLVSQFEWILRMKELFGAGVHLPVVPLISFAFDMDEGAFHRYERAMNQGKVRIDTTRTSNELAKLGMVLPELSPKVVGLTIAHLISRDRDLATGINRRGGELLARG